MKIFLIFLLHFASSSSALQCVDHNNNPVDWFAVYKLPEIKHHQKLLTDGVSYTYVTSDDLNEWNFSNISINSTSSIVGLTLQSLYENNKDTLYVLYNDEPPTGSPNSNKGHTKGVVLADKKGGIWLIHSVPHFPPQGPNYIYPSTASKYGQSFLCISLDLNNLNSVGKQLQYNEPEIYHQNIPKSLKKYVPDLADAAVNTTVKKSPWYHTVSLISKAGVNFTSFAKSKNFGKDLYADWVAPILDTDLLVETWPNGPGRLPSKCANHSSVFNVESVAMDVANVTFTATNDHSKWAVSRSNEDANWICIGDINRMESQKTRGGGTVCTDSQKFAGLYQKCITDIQKC